MGNYSVEIVKPQPWRIVSIIAAALLASVSTVLWPRMIKQAFEVNNGGNGYTVALLLIATDAMIVLLLCLQFVRFQDDKTGRHSVVESVGLSTKIFEGPAASTRRNTTAAEILSDPAASFWMKSSLKAAMDRDPVDAANDAELLAAVLVARSEETLGL